MFNPCELAPAQKAPPRLRRFVGVVAAFTVMVIIAAATYCQTHETCKVVLEIPELGPDEIVTFKLEDRSGKHAREDEKEITLESTGRYEFCKKPGEYTASVRRRKRYVGYCPGLGIVEDFRLYPTQSKVLNVEQMYGR
jgi:hypothetical protein